MLPVLQIGPLTISTQGLIIILGLWIGLSLAEKHSNKHDIEANFLYNLVFTFLIVSIITARLVYVTRYPSSFLTEPINIVALNPNMLDLSGGLAGGVLSVFIIASRKNLRFSQIMDTLTPILGVLAIFLSLANFASGDAYGAPADLPWAIELWGARRHPVQVYEALSAGLTLFILWPGRTWLSLLKPGGYFWAFLALSSFNRLILEAWRGDSMLILGKYRGIQLLALTILLLSLWVLGKRLANLITSAQSENKSTV